MTHTEKINCDCLIANYVNLVNLNQNGNPYDFEWGFTDNTPAKLIDIISAEICDESWYMSTLRFDISLDWSMTVLEKIQSEGFSFELGIVSKTNRFYCKIWKSGSFDIRDHMSNTGKTPQEAVYLVIVEYIKYKNSLPTKE